MNVSWNESKIVILLTIFVFLLGIAMAPIYAQQGPEVRVTQFNNTTDSPDIAVDSRGNAHIVFTVGEQQNINAGTEIYYSMLDNNGNIDIRASFPEEYLRLFELKPGDKLSLVVIGQRIRIQQNDRI